ncbi:hypothetical protein JYU34_000741 [Plutella xylostella]|uniref:KIF-binding protein n=1 Tax=Plutella xylostella TaxID=51655 RepID=A0ABQ7R8H1_PLUXY|nr:hypothetical protein JYU34_000741 [Plutella xylostella]
MDALVRINQMFESFRSAIRDKRSVERGRAAPLLHALGGELAALGRRDRPALRRAAAMQACLSLLAAKNLPLSLLEKRNTLQAAFHKLKPHYLKKECLFIFLRVQNLLCYYLIQLDQLSLAQTILENMETLYDNINKTQPFEYVDAEDLFTPAPVEDLPTLDPAKIDQLMTNNIEMQAFLYNKLGLQHKYVLYSHTALRRRLETRDCDPVAWAVRAARLARHFLSLQQLAPARHHLCAAYKLLRSCRDQSKLLPDQLTTQPDFDSNFLELCHYWIKYGLTIFQLSKKKILNKHFGDNPSQMDWWKAVELDEKLRGAPSLDQVKETTGEGDATAPDESLYQFKTLELEEWERPVPLALVTNMDEAKRLFAFTHKWVTRARRYCDLDQSPSQHVSCSLQLAELYEHLAFFERDVDRQYGIQKCRAEVLESLHSVLKTCDSTAAQVEVIRELSQVQLELMALNLQKLWREESRTQLNSEVESVVPSMRSGGSGAAGGARGAGVRLRAAAALTARLNRLSGQLADPPRPFSLHSTRSKSADSSVLN